MSSFEKNLDSGFFGFWVKKYKVSFLIILIVLILGIASVFQIPKESTPDIEIPVLQVTTTYQGVNADDIDSLITDDIVRQLSNIDGIRQIDATSSLGVSSITIELYDNIDPRDKLITVQDEIDSISLPSEADDPVVSDVTTEEQLIFDLVLHSEEYSQDSLKEYAREIRDEIEGRGGVANVSIRGSADYDYELRIQQGAVDEIGIGVSDIASTIRAFHSNSPLGNYEVGDFTYDFRVQGEFDDMDKMMDLIVHGEDGSYVRLSDIGYYERVYEDDAKRFAALTSDEKKYNSVVLSFEKDQQSSVFAASNFAKEEIENILSRGEFDGIGYFYTSDLADLIIQDYNTLAKNGLITLALVFTLLFLFIGLKQSILASLMLPLAFLITFFVLDYLGLTMNFLTNFSLVLSFGIAIDVIIVIVEGATQKMKLGYSPRNAILLAIRDLSKPMISGAATTLGAFLPLMFLPGMMGNFLSYIPITVFSVVAAALVLSLTLNSAVFYKLNRNPKFYIKNSHAEDLLSDEEKFLLDKDRSNKEEKEDSKKIKDKFFDFLQDGYVFVLNKVLKYRINRLLIIISPVILLVLSFIYLSPKIGFTLFPNSDTDFMQVSIEGPNGASNKYMLNYIDGFENIFNDILEIENYSYTIDGNDIGLDINLLSVNERDSLGMKDIFEVESIVLDRLSYLESRGFDISTTIQSGGPPSGSPVGVRIVADNIQNFDDLLDVGRDFQDWLSRQDAILSTSLSSSELPGQYVFEYKDYALAEFDLSPDVINNELFSYLNGVDVGSIKRGRDEFDVVVKSDRFGDALNPSDIMDIQVGGVKIGDLAKVSIGRAVDRIQRRDQDIVINVEGEIVRGQESKTAEIQSAFTSFAEEYDYPVGISYQQAGEAQENMDLIISTLVAFLIALIVIFSILVLQFNSYLQPIMILYSVVMAMLGVNIGLWLTGNPYSMPFAIGFVALTGIVVNNAIILIDRINSNIEQTGDTLKAVVESGRSRLTPIILTTLTTIFGILPLSLEDEFWAGLGFTVIFGLAFAGTMTLFVIPSIYYELFARKSGKRN